MDRGTERARGRDSRDRHESRRGEGKAQERVQEKVQDKCPDQGEGVRVRAKRGRARSNSADEGRKKGRGSKRVVASEVTHEGCEGSGSPDPGPPSSPDLVRAPDDAPVPLTSMSPSINLPSELHPDLPSGLPSETTKHTVEG